MSQGMGLLRSLGSPPDIWLTENQLLYLLNLSKVRVQSTHRHHGYEKLAYISYAIILNTNTLNYHYCLNLDDVRIRGRISPVGSIIFQCQATAQQVEIASWLHSTVLKSFKWCNITI